MDWQHPRRLNARDLTTNATEGGLSENESVDVYEIPTAQVFLGFQAEQVILGSAVWIIGFAAALARVVAFVPAKRRGRGGDEPVANRVAFACVAGFFTVAWLGVLGITLGNDWVLNNRHWIVFFAPIIGFLGPEQQRAFLITMLEVGMRLTKPKDDETK